MTLAEAFDPRANAIGFLRFALAGLVLLSHSFILGGFGVDPLEAWARYTSLGVIAVDGFFVISGFLITRSFVSAPTVTNYLWRRFLRIFPGYWACLLVTALVFAPMAYMFEHGSLAGADWVHGDESPLGYVRNNLMLLVYQWNIWHLLSSTPLGQSDTPVSFDGSLWTLRYEFECYLLVALMGLALRRAKALVIGWSLLLWLGLIGLTVDPNLAGHLPHGLGLNWLVGDPQRVRLWLMFSFGMVAALYARGIKMRPWSVVVATAVCVASMPLGWYELGTRLLFAYAILGLAVYLPVRSFDRRRDLSYGIYIYAFPIQQLLALLAVPSVGWWVYFVSTAVGTLVLAGVSWSLVERPPQRYLKHLDIPGVQRVARLLSALPLQARPRTSAADPE